MSLENSIAADFKHGLGLTMGLGNIIEENVQVGDNVTIKNFVELRKGTVFGDNCYIDSRVSTSGGDLCRIGNNVTLRYGSIIARGVEIADDVFISPQLMTENIDQFGKSIGGAKIGVGKWDQKTTHRVFIGTNVTLAAGITICAGSIIGTKANVRKSITKPGIYLGNPARLFERKTFKITKGKNVVIHEGARIGAEPYAFTGISEGGEHIEPKAGVTIGNNVWIGTNTTIMRGLVRDTHIGNDVKIGQMCNIGHDSILEDGSRICVGTEMGGYTRIGKNTYISMGVTIRNRAQIGAYSLIGQGSNVVSDIPDNVIAYGNPCKVKSKRYKPIDYYLRRSGAARHLRRLIK